MTTVVIGNFDGVHRGHQALLAQGRAIADAGGHRCVVLTFDPHPREVLGGRAGEREPPRPRLTTLDRRIELLRAHGADGVVVQPFTLEFAALPPEQFARDLLATRLAAKAVVVGRNFRFGAKRAGDLPKLRTLGVELGFSVAVAQIAGDAQGNFSSTRARAAISAGDLTEAANVLGRPHSIEGKVEKGDQRGRTIGFPTANLGGVVEMLPPHGVYAIRTPGHAGVMNIGVRPTVDGTKLRIEAHLFDFDGDLYGQALRTDLVARIRGEQKFDGLEALKHQIALDVEAAKGALAAPSGSAS
jgi:riboflavin kinase/FMN adenylyltransferase